MTTKFFFPAITRVPRRQLLLGAGALATLALAGCATPTASPPPRIEVPAHWKSAPAAPGWQAAEPGDTLERGPWWQRFGDPVLDQLAERLLQSNQNIAVAVAAYTQSQALVREQESTLFPSVGATGGAQRSRTRSGTGNSLSAGLGVDWAPDLWGRLSLGVGSAQAQAQASEADLASARLSLLGNLAANYFSLRQADAILALLDETLAGYTRALELTRNRYAAGIAAQSDVLQAQTQLANTRATRAAQQASRDVLEHAIAVLTGVAPADFSLVAEPAWTPRVPAVPLAVPSTLLQRRPDIAAAERTVAAANARIGIERTAYYPSVSLSGALSRSSNTVAGLFSASNTLWSLGLSVAQTLFDAGARDARMDQVRAAYEGTVAQYRQTVLTAFQSVEDQLSTAQGLLEQERQLREAADAAQRTEQQFLNRYRAGQIAYTEVINAQVAVLNARRSLLQVLGARQQTAVGLIQALGGGWEGLSVPPS
jgi:NodT family efflux transporter outer membrane factor (OMF) lipoprotein